MKKVSLVLFLLLLFSPLFSSNLDKLLKTTVNDEPLNIRALPSTDSKKVGKLFKGNEVIVCGFSDTRENIDGYNGYWVKIAIYDEEYEYWDFGQKWIFSKYIDIDKTLDVSILKPLKLIEDENRLEISIIRKNGKVTTSVDVKKLNGQEFYTFNYLYNYFNKDTFSYSDPTGTFVYYPSTNEIKHITVLGESEESSWGLFTNDFRFFLQDFGTGPGIRALGIIDLTTNEEIFSGHHLRDLGYDGESIIICETSSLKTKNYEMIPNTERAKARDAQTNISREMKKGKKVVDRYRYNLYTGEVKYIDYTFITEQ